MKQTDFLIPTTRNYPSDAEIISHKLLIKGGYIKQNSSGMYTYLPLGLMLLNNIIKIIKEEFQKINLQEILMPSLQDVKLWEKTNRIDSYNDLLFMLNDRHNKKFILGPTHEEMISSIISSYVNSYKQLPLTLYQISNKYRDEYRPRYGLMRAREFMMMDAYSFNKDKLDLDNTYNVIISTYEKIFKRLNLFTKKVSAITGEIGGEESHEFMVLSNVGEDTIYYSDNSDLAVNKEIYPDLKEGEYSEIFKGIIKAKKCIEIGHVFKLGLKYSKDFNASYLDKNGKKLYIHMGCYGIGISRIMMALLEQENNEDLEVIKWSKEVAPFKVHILIYSNKNKEDFDLAIKLYEIFKQYNIEVLIDERNVNFGCKLKDSELIGSPYKIIVKEKQILYKNEVFNDKNNIVQLILDEVYLKN